MIIIKTPQPDTEERLVLVPPDAVSRTEGGDELLTIRTANARDATPADLARGGYVAEAESIAGNVLDFVVHTFDPGIRSPQAAWNRVLHEYGAVITRAEKAEGLLIQRETELRLAREDGAAVERQMREARSAADASFVRANRADMRAEKAEREREEAEGKYEAMVSAHTHLADKLARLTVPGEEEPTYEALGEHYRNAWDASKAMLEMGRRHDAYAALYRLGVAHERARHAAPVSSTPVTSDRATEDELEELYATAYARAHGRADEETLDKGEYAGLRAVAARVRQERCLVAQAVRMGADVRIEETPRNYGASFGGWTVSISTRGGPGVTGPGVTFDATHVPAAEVPATLARLLGEVGRG